MKGKIRKLPDYLFGKWDFYAIEYMNRDIMFVPKKDMPEFMDDIFSSWMKLDNKTEIVERRATEAVKARKELHQCEKEEAYREGYANGKKEVITKQEEAEQDRDRREIDGETKAYNNPFPTDEALDFDVNVRERV